LIEELGDLDGISPSEFVETYPQVFHMAEYGTWETIRALGLLSTSALLDLCEVTGDRRTEIESCRRPHAVLIEHPMHGQITIRDQIPMREKSLSACLEGLTPREWYELLNHKVFFWASRDRLLTLLKARAYRNRPHLVLTIDAALLIERYLDRIALSAINSGSTIFTPQPRGLRTFQPLHLFPFSRLSKKRGAKKAVAEVAVEHGVPDLRETVLRAVHMKGAETLNTVFARDR